MQKRAIVFVWGIIKPGIILGNLLTMSGGFYLASKNAFDSLLFISLVVGLTLIIASSAVVNNITDCETDRKMRRVHDRLLPTKRISLQSALLLSLALLSAGVTVLFLTTDRIILALALLGFLIYTVLYGCLKYQSSLGTLIGSLSGTLPPIIGYYGGGKRLDMGALLLAVALVCWQMPHFYTFVLHHIDDYSATSLCLSPLHQSRTKTKLAILFYISAFIAFSLSLFFLGYAGKSYAIPVLVVGALWLIASLYGFTCRDEKYWAKQMFRLSVVVISTQSLMMVVDSTLR